MFTSWKYRSFLFLSFLALVVVTSPTLVEAVGSNKSDLRIEIAQEQTGEQATESAQIRKSVLLNEQKYHWRPQVDILAIADGYALTSVHDQNTGGESVLKKKQGDWKVICGTGGAFSKANTLAQHCKIPIDTASNLLQIKSNQRRSIR